jgi:hypothetical protein
MHIPNVFVGRGGIICQSLYLMVQYGMYLGHCCYNTIQVGGLKPLPAQASRPILTHGRSLLAKAPIQAQRNLSAGRGDSTMYLLHA